MLSQGIGRFAKENGFSFTSGARAYFGMVGAAYGEYKHLRFTLIHDARELHQTMRVYMPFAEAEGAGETAERLCRELAEIPAVRKAFVEEHCVCVDYWHKLGQEKPEQVADLLDRMTKYAHKYHLRPGCCVCGEPAADFVGYEDVPYYACGKCAGHLSDFHLSTTEKRKKEPLHALRGFLGALLFSLIGFLLWVVMVSFLGKIGGIAGYVIIYGALKGYQLFGGRLNRATAVGLLALSIAVMLFGQFVSVVLLEARAAIEAGASVSDAIIVKNAVALMLETGSIGDVVWGLAFVVAGWCVHLLGLFRKPHNSIGLESLN